MCPYDELGHCMSNSYLCDSYDDCPSGFDEQNCSTSKNTYNCLKLPPYICKSIGLNSNYISD